LVCGVLLCRRLNHSCVTALETCTGTVCLLSPPIPAELQFHPHPSPQKFHSIPTHSSKVVYLLIKFPITDADVSICVILVIKHASKVLHMKEMDVGFTCWCRCTIKVKYNYTFTRESRKIFSIPAGVRQHLFPSSREPHNSSFHPRGNPAGSARFT